MSGDSTKFAYEADETLAQTLSRLAGELQRLKEGNSPSLPALIEHTNRIVEQMRLAVGAEVALLINRFEGQPVGDLDQKRGAAKSISDLADGLGLRPKCPKTGKAAALLANPSSDGKPAGRFLIKMHGNPKETTYSANLPSLEFTLKDMETRHQSYRVESDQWRR